MKKILLLIIFIICMYENYAQCWQLARAGASCSGGIKIDGTLWMWGSNSSGMLGNNNNIFSNIPIQITNATDWKDLSIGFNHSIALKNDNSLWTWGYNGTGSLGDGTLSNKATPTRVGNANDWNKIFASPTSSYAIKQNGTLWAWGENIFYQLGDGTGVNSLIPIQIGTATDWNKISCNQSHCLATKQNGTLWAWGQNVAGTLGDNTTDWRFIPTQIGTATDWYNIAAGYKHSIATKNNGTLWSWGSGDYGALGNGIVTGGNTLIPTQVGTANDWINIAADREFSMGTRFATGGFFQYNLYTWGNGSRGQLGSGVVTNAYTPTLVNSSTDWYEIAAGSAHAIALKTNLTLMATGINNAGQLGNSTNNNSNIFIPISCPTTTNLPIKLLSFTAKNNSTSNLLNWATANETNSKNFEVQRSTNGIHFTTIGVVNAAGNTSITANYNFTDNAPIYGINYYRLKQNDIDGKFEYSPIVRVNNTKLGAVVISPNPAANDLYVDGVKNNSQYFITDMVGRIVLSGVYENNKPILIDKLPSAVYFLKIDNEVYKFIKQ